MNRSLHSFPPHLICVATLPENTLATEQVTLLSSGWVAVKRSWMMCSIDDCRIPVFLEMSDADLYVCSKPSWLNIRSSTRPHYLQYAQFMVCHSLDTCQLTNVLSFFISLRRLRWFQLLLPDSSSKLCTVYTLTKSKFLFKIRSLSNILPTNRRVKICHLINSEKLQSTISKLEVLCEM